MRSRTGFSLSGFEFAASWQTSNPDRLKPVLLDRLFMDPKSYERYSRQILFGEIGEAGQQRLLESSAVIVGCGALGTALANLLVRAGVGKLRIVDRDFVEPSNLQRQTLFEESDAQEALPKAVAAERRLRAINSGVSVEGIVADVESEKCRGIIARVPADSRWHGQLRDALPSERRCDPFECSLDLRRRGRQLWRDAHRASRRNGVPCVRARIRKAGTGRRATGTEDTCDTVGVLGAAAGVIASIEAAEAIKLLVGKSESAGGRLVSFDVWSGRFQSVRVARNPECRACVRRDFRYLEGEAQPHLTMCGRDSVQIHERRRQLDLAALGKRIAPTVAEVRENGFLLRFRVPPYEMTVFADGRAIIKGTRDTSVARSLYARYIGV